MLGEGDQVVTNGNSYIKNMAIILLNMSLVMLKCKYSQ